jgi:hypothetical protein
MLNGRTLAMLGTTEKHTEGTTNSNALSLLLKKSMRWVSSNYSYQIMLNANPVIHPFLAAAYPFVPTHVFIPNLFILLTRYLIDTANPTSVALMLTFSCARYAFAMLSTRVAETLLA